MANRIIFSADSHSAIMKGTDELADAVKVTYGPKGRSVMIEKKAASPVITRDGVTVANEISLPDTFENMGAKIIRDVATKTSDDVGDGTTTATLLARVIMREGFKLVAAGANPVALRRGIEKAVETAVMHLANRSQPLQVDVSEAVKLSPNLSLPQIVEQENLAASQSKKLLDEIAKLKKKGVPVVARVLLAAKTAGVETKAANRIARKLLESRALLDRTFQELNGIQVKKLATNSASNDSEIGMIISEAFAQVGTNGVVTIEESKTLQTTLEVMEGMSFERGYISPYFVTDEKSREAVLENPLILIHEKKISAMKELLPVLEQVSKLGRAMLVIAEDVEGDALATLTVNNLRGTLRIAAVKSPFFGERRKAMLEDIAIITGGRLISEDLGLTLESVRVEDLGTALRVIVEKENTTIIKGGGERAIIDDRVRRLRAELDDVSSEYDRERLLDRTGKLLGRVAVIKVGATTDAEAREKKARVEDALHSTRAALQEGVVAGGGVALLGCVAPLEQLKLDEDENFGVRVVKLALEEPMRQIAFNAGFEGSVIVAQVRNSNLENFGFNAELGEFADLVQAGVIDPTKVTRLALQNAASVASVMLTTGSMVADGENETMPNEKSQ